MIRKFQREDTRRVMQIWLNGNEEAHAFVPKDYWKQNYSMVEEQLLQADVFINEMCGEIRGFIGIVDGYIAGIFVDKAYRSLGLGKQLLDDAKQRYRCLSLSVYRKNQRAVAFYFREGFSIQSEGVDEATGEVEYTMLWRAGAESIS